MIPKKIHYCWFGKKPLPDDLEKYISSWKKFLPDYEIILWNEDNFDVASTRYSKEAYDTGNYAHVSDYARFKILKEYGGIYLDTDVEIVNQIDDIIEKGPFMANESSHLSVAPGLIIACDRNNKVINDLHDIYLNMSIYNISGELDLYNTVVKVTTNYFKKNGAKESGETQFVKGFTIYSYDYFCPMDFKTGKLFLTKNTRSIHWYKASWLSEDDKYIRNAEIRIFAKYPIIIANPMAFTYRKLFRMRQLIRRVLKNK